MLRNPIYRGECIWNRSYWVKDHETGRRKRLERPESEWVRQQGQGWRIVSDELWHATQKTRGVRNERLRVYKDGRIEGSATLSPEMIAAPGRTSEPRVPVVAGGRYAPCSLPVPLMLPVVGQVEGAPAAG